MTKKSLLEHSVATMGNDHFMHIVATLGTWVIFAIHGTIIGTEVIIGSQKF
jgi:hypothetical protein